LTLLFIEFIGVIEIGLAVFLWKKFDSWLSLIF
jgi:hypothetical protein